MTTTATTNSLLYNIITIKMVSDVQNTSRNRQNKSMYVQHDGVYFCVLWVDFLVYRVWNVLNSLVFKLFCYSSCCGFDITAIAIKLNRPSTITHTFFCRFVAAYKTTFYSKLYIGINAVSVYKPDIGMMLLRCHFARTRSQLWIF